MYLAHIMFTQTTKMLCVCVLCAVLLNCCQNSVDESFNDGYTIIESTWYDTDTNIDNWHSIEPEHYFAFNTSDFNVMPRIAMYLNQMSEANKNEMEQDYS